MTKNDLSKFEEKIGYRFQKKDLLQNALTHSSYANEKHLPYEKNNERLEFLGDAVLELVSSDFIFHEQATAMEGKMSKFRASLVCERSLAQTLNTKRSFMTAKPFCRKWYRVMGPIRFLTIYWKKRVRITAKNL